MSRGYQRFDAGFVDYELYELPGVHGVFRGPPVRGTRYIACIGGAQTFGRFVEDPFPRLLASELNVETLNLGRGGAGPSFPLRASALLDYINGAEMAIVQVFSGRSQSNSLFRTIRDGMSGTNLVTGQESTADEFYTWLLQQNEDLVRKTVEETRENYVAAMTQLLASITQPAILFWFSVRTPDYQEHLELPLAHLFGDFPQLVNRSMIDRLRSRCSYYVECSSRRGLPHLVMNSRQNSVEGDHGVSAQEKPSPVTNKYYPSPEMHEDAAALLVPVCREILTRHA